MSSFVLRLLGSRSRAMIALEYMAIVVVLVPAAMAAFQLIGHGLVTAAQTKVQNELTFSNIPDQNTSGSLYGSGSETPPENGG